jgi:apolipoprotein N-acyltransferase
MIRLATLNTRFRWLPLAAIPFLWVAMEFALARIPNFPWDQLGDSQVDNPLLTQIAPWAGVYGISFVLAGVNALLAAAAVLSQNRKQFSASMYCGTLGVLLAVVGMAGFLVKAPRPAVQATAVLIQPNLNVSTDDVWTGPEWDKQLAQFEKLGAQTCKEYIKGMPETGAPQGAVECGPNPTPAELVVWPESPAPFRELDPRFQSAIGSIVAADKAPMIVGNVGMDAGVAGGQERIYNSASVVEVGGQFVGRYDKIHLVPFGEYIPFRRLFFFAKQLTQNLSDMGGGDARKTFRVGGHRYGIFICYESVFADEIRQFTRMGAEVLVNISDDGWYGDTSAPWQHLNMARMRAIENRRWILRDTNNGTTASIDPYGTVRQSIPRHKVDALPAEFGFNRELTFYTVHGDLLAVVCAILSLALVVWSARSLLGQFARKTVARPVAQRS